MNHDEFWTSVYSGKNEPPTPARLSLLRLVLLFGVVAAAMALVVPPLLDPESSDRSILAAPAGIDYFTTSSVNRKHQYSVRRSVVQDSVEAVCIIDVYGNRSGDC